MLLAIGILLYFRSVASSSTTTAGEDPDTFEALLNTYQSHTNGNGANGNGHAPAFRANGNGTNGHSNGATVLTPTELSRLIRENPDNASQALKAWLRRN